MDDHSYKKNETDTDEDFKYKEFLEMTRAELVNYLTARGQSTSGGKMSLAARAFTAWENNIPLKLSTEKHQENLSQEYESILRNHGISDPNKLPANLWSKDVDKWPLVNMGNIFSYIIQSTNFSADYIGKYKSQKAFSYFASKFVGPLLFANVPNNEDFCFITGEVTPSQSVRGERHKPWLYIKNSGEIQTGWCTCTAGFSQTCNHVIAVLYKIEYAISNFFNTPSCTDKGCQWNSGTLKSVQPSRVEDLDFRVDRAGQAVPLTSSKREEDRQKKRDFDPRRESERCKSSDQIGDFFNGLSKILPNAVIFTGIAAQIKQNQEATLPLTIPQLAINFRDNFQSDESEIYKMFNEHIIETCTKGMCDNLEKNTREQSNSSLWCEQRKGRVTASQVHRVAHKVDELLRKKSAAVTPIIDSLLNGGDNLNTLPAIQWGRHNEKSAIGEFVDEIGPHHQNMRVLPAGLFVMKHKPYIGASPDGIVVCDCHDSSVLEIKSPYKIKGLDINEHFNEIDYLIKDSENDIILKESHSYYSQIQCEMAVTELKKCYFCVSTGNGKPLIISVARNEEMWASTELKIDMFFKTYMTKYLLGIKDLSYCPQCSKVISELEFGQCDYVCCCVCGLKFHMKCQQSATASTTNFMCTFCTQAVTG